MSDPKQGKREWRLYLHDMIEFAQKVQSYTDGLDQAINTRDYHLDSVFMTAAITEISTSNSGRARLASTQARAGENPSITHASQISFM